MAFGNVYIGKSIKGKTDDDYRRQAEAARAALKAQDAAQGEAQGAIGDSSVAPNTGYQAGNTKGANSGAFEVTEVDANPYLAALNDADWDQHDWSQYAAAAERDEAAAKMGMNARERLRRFGWVSQDGRMFAGANNMQLGKDPLSLYSGNFTGPDGKIYNYDTAPDDILDAMGLARMYGKDSQGNTLTWVGKFDDSYALARKAQEVLETQGEEAAAEFWDKVPGARALDLYIQKDVNGNPLYTGESYGVSERGERRYEPMTEYGDANGNTYTPGYIDVDFYHALQEAGKQYGIGGNGGIGGSGGNGGNGYRPSGEPGSGGTYREERGLGPGGSYPERQPDASNPGRQPGETGGQTPYAQAVNEYDYGTAPEYGGDPYRQRRDDLAAALGQQYGGNPYESLRDEALGRYGEAWQGSPYQQERDAALRRAQEMQWDYDPDADPVWQAYQKQYRREGQRAVEDTLGRISGMTGGMPSSYAATAAAQAGDYYASQLSDKLPELYQDAYQRYLQDYMKEMNISDQYAGFDDREYSRWRDQQGKDLDLADRYDRYGQEDYGRFQDLLDRYGQQAGLYNQYGQEDYDQFRDQLSQWNADRSFRYGLNRDAVEDARYEEEKDYNRRWAEDERRYSRWMDQLDLDYREKQWAQQLLEYADSQKWKAAEWEQYLREYEDQMSEKEREWAYRAYQDQVEQERWQTQFEYGRQQDEQDRQYKDDVYAQSLREYDDELYDNALKLWYSTGVVPDGYAELLGYPAGTKWDDVYGDQEPEEVYRGTMPPGTEVPNNDEDTLDLSDEDAMAAALGEKTGNAQTFVPGVKHEDGSPMSTGWQDWWPEIRDAFDQGASTAELKQAILWLATNGIITSAEATLMGKKLGIYKSGNSGGGAGR